MPMPSKACKWCGSKNHWPYQCRLNEKAKKQITKGKHAKKWEQVKQEWYKNNFPNTKGYYECYICGKWIDRSETTLDHIKPRSSYPHLRYEMDNIAACCYRCNSNKGSKSLGNYLKSIA